MHSISYLHHLSMAKLPLVSIISLLLLLLLAIALPLSASGATPSTTEVVEDCFQRDESGEDIDKDCFMHSNVELESDLIDEQSDDDEGFYKAEASYIEMPSDDNHDDDHHHLAEDSDDSSESCTDNSDLEEEEEEDGKLGIPVKSVVTKAFFDSIISKASPSCAGKKFYRRKHFLNATRSYPKFGQLTNATAAKREIAAFFAHVTHETGHLCYIEEIYKGTYCDQARAKEWPCAPGKKYYGRGPLQLTWNYNYGLFGREKKLNTLKNPDMVAKKRVLCWSASLWFWMKNVRPVLKKGFAATIKAINGGECNGGNPRAVAARVKYYKDYCKRFGIKPGRNLSC